MNFYENAKIIATEVLTQKWNNVVANDELRNAHYTIHSIVMGTSEVFHFSVQLEGGRVHDFKIKGSQIVHKIID